MKIKTFEFVVNCFTGSYTYDGGSSSYPRTDAGLRSKGVVSPQQADATVNQFMQDKEVLSVRDNFYTADRHNNGYNDTVIRSVTVVYEE